MTDFPVEQALFLRTGRAECRLLGRSPGFLDDWLPEAERLCAGFGDRPAGVACPGSVFSVPLGKRHVAVVQVADQGHDLAFRFLVLPGTGYRDCAGDPFAVAERFPPPWHTRGELETLAWPCEPLPRRTVAEVRRVLKAGPGPTLLGGAQALVDGGRLVFERPAPDPELLRKLWLLLPYSTRADLRPASFAFGNAVGFDVLVVPRAGGEEFADCITEEQAGDYPEGRYELNLQIAAEAGDQGELDALFARRSSAQTWRLGLILLVAVGILAGVMNCLTRPGPKPPPAPAAAPEEKTP